MKKNLNKIIKKYFPVTIKPPTLDCSYMENNGWWTFFDLLVQKLFGDRCKGYVGEETYKVRSRSRQRMIFTIVGEYKDMKYKFSFTIPFRTLQSRLILYDDFDAYLTKRIINELTNEKKRLDFNIKYVKNNVQNTK